MWCLEKEKLICDKLDTMPIHLVVKNRKKSQSEIIEALKVLLLKDADVNAENRQGQTALDLAVQDRKKDVIDFLIEGKANFGKAAHFLIEDEYEKFDRLLKANERCLDFHESDWTSKKHEQIQTMEAETVSFLEWLILKGCDFDCRNKMNQSAVYKAVEWNLQHILPVLLKSTKDISFVDREKRTLLHFFLEKSAIFEGNRGYQIPDYLSNWYSNRHRFDIVTILLDRGVPANAEDVFNRTPIEVALLTKQDSSIIEILIARSFKIQNKRCSNGTLLHLMTEHFINRNWETQIFLNILRSMIAKGMDTNKLKDPDEKGWTILCYAVFHQNTQLIDFLRENSVDFSVITNRGDNLLHLLSKSYVTTDENTITLLNLLVNKGCQINAKNVDGKTPLHEAVKRCNVTLVEKLISLDAEVNSITKDGMTPLLISAEEKCDLHLIKLLLAAGADPSMTTNNKENLLHLLPKCYSDDTDEKEAIAQLDLFIENGCQINAKDASGMTPLHKAAYAQNVTIVQKLIENGAGINCRNNKQETPLHISVLWFRDVKVVELLLANGANVNAKDLEGQTALHTMTLLSDFYVCSKDTIVLVSTLLKWGADVNAHNLEGRSVFCYICARKPPNDEYYPLNRWDEDHNEVEYLSEEAVILMDHFDKLKAVNLPWDKEIDSLLGNCKRIGNDYRRNTYHATCLKEIEKLKSSFVDNRISLYTLLHMNLKSRCIYLRNEKWQKLVRSPKLQEQFPVYDVLILSNYRETVTRKSLLEPAKMAWVELTKIRLPDICIELILSFVSNSDLYDLLEEDA